MAEYEVMWITSVEAESFAEAAVKAQEQQRDPKAEVGEFTVTDSSGKQVVVDLDQPVVEAPWPDR
jgi:hypothetical protein